MLSVWRRQRQTKLLTLNEEFEEEFEVNPLDHFENGFQVIEQNKCLDIDTKLAALKVSPSLVLLVSHLVSPTDKDPEPEKEKLGKRKRKRKQKLKRKQKKEKLFVCSGTIIECEEEKSNGRFVSTILTAASLIRHPSGEPALAGDIKVDVYLSDGKLCKGKVSAFDFHFNVATVMIRSDAPLPKAILRRIDDSLLVNPSALSHKEVGSSSFQLRRHVDKPVDFKLCPGDRVIAVGRHYSSCHLMAAPGQFCVAQCNFDCKELFMASCKITKSGIGGPLINRNGEVIGMNFCYRHYTPFLSMNITSKCLEDLKKHGRVRRPWLGIEVTNLYAAYLYKLDNIVQKFPSICKGVIVEKVIPESPADCAGICLDDVIVQYGGKDVGCSSEFFEIMWDKAGESVEVVVLRASVGARLNLTMVADENLDEYYKWPVAKEIPTCDGWVKLE